MPRECNCAGGCAPMPEESGLIRLEAPLQGAKSAAELGVGGYLDWLKQQGQAAELAAWKKALHGPGEPRRYASDKHLDARFPLGGIGTGTIELGADGRLTTWQLFNTLRDGYVPCFFGVKAGKTPKLLQTTGGFDAPRVKRIEMTGEYPLATLKFLDADLPVELEMTAFSPFAPLDTAISSIPAAIFVFKVRNPTGATQTVSLGAFMQNPIGYDAMGVPISFNSVGFNAVAERLIPEHPNYGGNINEARPLTPNNGGTGRWNSLFMSALAAAEPTIDRPLHVYTNQDVRAFNAPPPDRPANLKLDSLNALSARTPERPNATVVWLEDAAADIAEAPLCAALGAAKAGGTVVFSGLHQPLLAAYAKLTGGKPLDRSNLRPDILFEDFESGYGKWRVEGDAFGAKPAAGTLESQQQVGGFLGHGLVNSFLGGDGPTGRMTSQEFKIERNFVRFLVGGGSHRDTQIRLVVDGRIARATSGKNDERLLPASWDVRDLAGRTAHIEIVDGNSGGWGHINVDQIEFTDLPGSAAVMALLEELLPIRFTDVIQGKEGIEFQGVQLAEGAKAEGVDYVAGGSAFGRGRFRRIVGTGSVVLQLGPILRAEQVELRGARQRAYQRVAELAGAKLTIPDGVHPKAPGYGTVALCAPDGNVLTDAGDFRRAWELFSRSGPVSHAESLAPSPAGQSRNGMIETTVTVPAGKTVEVPFVMAWHYPNKYSPGGEWMGNHYCTVWPDAHAVARQVAADLPALREKTERFRKTFYDSNLPYWLLDCITSQASTIRHIGVVFRIANGDVYGWEGSNGCCTPTCTHVWGYEQSLSRLFPDLERDMRRIDYKHQQRADGGINNRTDLPSPPRPSGENPFSDGHASCVLKAYREALNAPSDAWLREYWPNIKKAVEFLIGRDAGGEFGQGYLQDDQWNTYDNAIHGVNTFISGYYLAALLAGEQMAQRMGDPAFANRCRTIWERGKDNLVQKCWNGDYFQQDLPDYMKRGGEYGPGCLSDQLIGQWWAHQLGLGYILPKERVQQAMKAVFAYNWLPDSRQWRHGWRKFAGGADRQLLICSWPKGGRPVDTIPYVDETWTGVEYQVAAHLIYEGMIDEAFSIIKGARDRYDGVPRAPMPRNPWNEIECGGHYARAMSSWSLLLALTGFLYNAMDSHLRFTPNYQKDNLRAFFAASEGWGTLVQTRTGKSQRNDVAVKEGRLVVSSIHVDPPASPTRVRVSLGRTVLPATLKPRMDGWLVALANPVTVEKGQALSVVLSA